MATTVIGLRIGSWISCATSNRVIEKSSYTIAFVQADFAVELGPDDETLAFPWHDESGRLRYFDLKRHPEQWINIEEAQRETALAEFLSAMNAGILETAKCDAWPSTEMNPEEEIFGASHKFGSYVDLLFSEEPARLDFARHEDFAKRLTTLLTKAPEIPAAADFLIRRCYYHQAEPALSGFYISFYLFGYGDDEAQAHQRWVIALKLVENAIRQASH